MLGRLRSIPFQAVALFLAFALLTALAWQGARLQQVLLDGNGAVNQSLELITTVQSIRSSLQDVETGERGFVITGLPIYLTPYLQALERIEGERRRLDEELQPLDEEQRQWLARLDRDIADRLEIASNNIRKRRDEGLQAAAAQLLVAGGRQAMDRLREHLAELENRERDKLRIEGAELRQHLRDSRRQLLLGGLLAMGLFFCSFWILSRSLSVRQRLTVEAQASETRLRALLKAIPDPLFEIDAAGQVRVLGNNGYELESLHDELRERLERCRSDEGLVSFHWQSPDGSEFEVRMLPTGGDAYLAIARNVTETQRARRYLRDQQAFLRSVVDADENLIFVRGADGRFLLCNEAFSALLQLSPTQVEGRLPADLPGIGLLEPLLAGDAELFDGRPELRLGELSLHDSQGRERCLQLLKRPLRLSDGSLQVLTVAVDISLRRQVEQMKGEFISTVSHELRTPLTAIRGALGMLSSGVAGAVAESQRSLLDIANRNSERLARLINDILDMEKLESGRLEFRWVVSPLRPLLEQALESNQPYAHEYQVALRLDVTADGPVRLDPDRFAQIMANLLSNAIKYSPPGGTVEVELRRLQGRMEVVVRDHGLGIPEDFQGRIFERFAQADASDARKRGGTGLGLAITRSLVEHLGGEIGFSSQTGKGTCFHVRLPLVEQEAEATTSAQASRPRLLVVDSDTRIASALAGLLEQQGYATLVADSAAQARRLLRETQVHALTVSPLLADEDGLSFLHGLRAQPAYRHLPVLVVSLSSAAGADAVQGGAVGMVDWLRPPLDTQRLVESVQACLGKDRPPHVLHVEDDQDLRRLVADLLGDSGLCIHGAGSLAEAREQLALRHHALVILDLILPDGDGVELFGELAEASPPTPVVIFSARDEPREAPGLILRKLVKSRHYSHELVGMIEDYLRSWPPTAAAFHTQGRPDPDGGEAGSKEQP